MRDQFRVPGTRILQFAFDGHPDNPYLPNNFVHNAVVFTGTHDNATTREWYEELPGYQRQNLWSYLKRAPGEGQEAAPALIELAWSSSAALAMAPLQDLLNLGSETRMNVPGRSTGTGAGAAPKTCCRSGISVVASTNRNVASLAGFESIRISGHRPPSARNPSSI
jgi:4-alpha-glucanotransferase